MSRLTIDVTDQQHQSLKAMAALQGKTLREYALERLFPKTSGDDTALKDLRALLEQRLAEAEGSVITKSFTEVADEEVRTSRKV